MTGRSIGIQELVALLSPTLGEEPSRELLLETFKTLQLSGPTVSMEEALHVLDLLGQVSGIVGSVARFAKVRLERVGGALPADAVSPAQPSDPPRAEPLTSADELIALLAPNLGQEKSAEIVHEILRRRRLPADGLALPRALEVLEEIASAKGVLNVAARFAKARLIMASAKR
jgi:hypothetical protein